MTTTTALIDGDNILHFALWKKTNARDAKESFDYWINRIQEEAFCGDRIIAFKHPYNFRLDLFPEYKAVPSRITHRENKPPYFDEVVHYIERKEEVASVYGLEADDLIAIWVNQFLEQSKSFVVITVDKDLDQLEGFHYNPNPILEKNFYLISPEEAKLNFLTQLLKGDPMDRIPGIPGIGPVKAATILAGKTVEEAKTTVIERYKLAFEENWFDHFLINAKLLWLLREEGKYFTWKTWESI